MIGPTYPSLVVFMLIAVSLVISEQTFTAVEDTTPCKYLNHTNGEVDLSCDNVSLKYIMSALRAMVQIDKKIAYLRLKNCKFIEIPGDMFDGVEVQYFIAENSSISSVHKNAFDTLASSLKILNLMHNQLTEIPVESLLPLRKLWWLRMGYNKIEEIPARAFSELYRLDSLALYNNKISKIDENAVEGIQFRLTRLELGKNHLTSVPVNALHSLVHLTKLQLSDNRISKITKEDFQDLTALQHLNLSYNLIESLPSQLFNKHKVLKHLDLGGNMIETISNDHFIEVRETLKWLSLDGNILGKIPVGALRPLYRLQFLDLSQNNISVIPENAFDSFSRNLEYLILSKNSIKHIPPLLFTPNHNLLLLDLSENQLQRIPMEIYQPILGKLEIIDLHNNPFICDCHMLWFREWLNSSDGTKVLYRDDTRCHEPTALRSQLLWKIPEIHFTCPMYQSQDSSQKISVSWSLLLNVLLEILFLLFLL